MVCVEESRRGGMGMPAFAIAALNQDKANLDSIHEEDMHLRMDPSVRLVF